MQREFRFNVHLSIFRISRETQQLVRENKAVRPPHAKKKGSHYFNEQRLAGLQGSRARSGLLLQMNRFALYSLGTFPYIKMAIKTVAVNTTSLKFQPENISMH